MRKMLLISAFMAGFSVFAMADVYELDVANSKVGFEVSHLKLKKVNGTFSDFSGKIDYANGKLEVFEGSVEIKSVDTADKKRDSHLNAPDMFDSATYPNMTFAMTEFSGGKIYGDLTIKDTTKPIAFDAKITEKGSNLTINATTSIKRSEFGISWDNVFKDNAVGDDVEISLVLQAKK